jgi:hypothetical protein
MPWTWAKGSPLERQTAHTPCETIFRAVCDELAIYFEPSGAKYARSRPKLTFKRDSLKLEIGLWSSRSNIPGEYVNLEVIPSFTSLVLAKSKGARRGYFFGHPEIFEYPAPDLPPKTLRVECLFDSPIESVEDWRKDAAIRFNHNFNVFGIDSGRFEMLAEFFEVRILSYFEVLTDRSRLDAYLCEPLADRQELKASEAMQAYIAATWGSD